MTIASYWTLIAEIASEEQAQHLLYRLLDSGFLGGDVPFILLSRSDAATPFLCPDVDIF